MALAIKVIMLVVHHVLVVHPVNINHPTVLKVLVVSHAVLVELGKDKRLLVLRQLIVYVHKMYVLVLTVLKQLERLVLHIMVISARLVLVTIIKRVVLAVPVWFVEMENEKPLLVLQQLIVFVLKMFVLVKTVFKQLERLVLQTMPTFVRPVSLDISKTATFVF